MDRSAPPSPPFAHREPLDEDDEEEKKPVLSQVFAVDQVAQGLENASAFLTWGFTALQDQFSAGEEKAKLLFEQTKPQRDALAENATKLGEDLASAAEQIKQETSKALEAVTDKLNGKV